MSAKTLPILFDEMFQGEYDFEHFLSFSMSNEVVQKIFDNKITFIASSTLKAYHRIIRRYVLRSMEINSEVVFSYRKDVNVVDALRKHAESKCFYQTDLFDFFPSINRDLVKSTLIKNSRNMPFVDFEEYVDRFADLMTFDSYVPRGFSTSPSLSNACLTEFDNVFVEYCRKNDLVYTRYSDDIVISGMSDEIVKAGSRALVDFLAELYGGIFSINQQKSRFLKVGRKIKILGMVILPNGSVGIELSLKRKMEMLLHFYSTDSFKFLDAVNDDLEKGTQMLAGYINFANAADKSFLEKLRKKYGTGVIDRLLHQEN